MDPTLYDALDGQVALVTGANRGIGRQVAANLLDLGATVYCGTRDPDADVPGEPVELDVTVEASIRAAVDRIADEQGRFDVLVNNAGIGEFVDDIEAMTSEQFDRTMAVNVRGPVLLAKYAIPHLMAHEGGRIVNLSSGMGALGEAQSGGSPAYRISKTAINGLTAYLHGEYGDRGLLANSVCPGWVRTDMGGEGASKSVEEGAETPTWLCRFRVGSPAGAFWRNKERIDW
jgi:NAD(P)-dependent dehydrogenase (short-subunit alcohol dehydrogenase family)